MLISLTCQSCGKSFKVDAKFAGRRGKCPRPECGRVFVVPDVSDEPADEWDEWLEPVARTDGRTNGRQARKTRRTRSPVLLGLGVSVGLGLIAVCLWPLLPGSQPQSVELSAKAAAAPDSKPVDPFPTAIAPFVTKHCLDCHSGDEPEAGLGLHQFANRESVLKQKQTWERVLQVVRGSIMPPEDGTQPTMEEREQFVAALDHLLHFVDCSGEIDPGRVTIRRLNRTEYNNTIRDLLGVTFQPADDFPSDDVGYGFDNIGDVLSLPPLLMEKYLDAAEKITQAAIVIPDPSHTERRQFTGRRMKLKGHGNVDDEDAGLYSTGEVFVEFDVPRDGEYMLRVRAGAQQAGDEPARMEFRLDGAKLKVFDVRASHENHTNYEMPQHLGKGQHRFAAAFINDYYDEKAESNRRDRNLYVSLMEVQGPLDIRPEDLPESHRRIVTVTPGPNRSVEQAAREILRPLMQRAFRRPVSSDEVNEYVELVKLAVSRGEPFEAGIQFAVQGVLVSPDFLFRIELDPQPDNPKAQRSLNDYELATRLSYFLWSSMPDDELFRHAEHGDLHTDAVLSAQVRRMLKDPKAAALVENFAGQWLQLRILDEVTPDPEAFPEFGDELRADMKRETELFFEHVMREDRSILEFLDGRYTFVNERLAKHYGLPNIAGDEFRKIDLSGTHRGGLLTQASILTLTSNPNRTSPVKRGKWILETILGAPPPPPPPNVPELEETAKASPSATLREQMVLHRENPACASCHRQMDELGFGFENFDAIGRWRDTDGEHPIDAAGELPDGGRFAGPVELTQVLKARKDEFARCFTEKLLTYALGRGLEDYDDCTVRGILDAVKSQEYRFSAIVTEIVHSPPFRMRRGED